MLDFFLAGNEKRFKAALKNILGFSPRNLSLYRQAFRHNSAAKEIREGVRDSNERLEYLGDSVLNAVVADFLFRKFPYKDEGFLTKARSKVVSRQHLNQLSKKMGLEKFIEQGLDPNLRFSSMHGDAFEALIGAIYLDRGFDATRHFIIKRILRYHVDVEKTLSTETDHKSRLIEWAQREKKNVYFRMLETTGDGYDKQYTISVEVEGENIAQAQHFSKKKAEQASSESACVKLGIA